MEIYKKLLFSVLIFNLILPMHPDMDDEDVLLSDDEKGSFQNYNKVIWSDKKQVRRNRLRAESFVREKVLDDAEKASADARNAEEQELSTLNREHERGAKYLYLTKHERGRLRFLETQNFDDPGVKIEIEALCNKKKGPGLTENEEASIFVAEELRVITDECSKSV